MTTETIKVGEDSLTIELKPVTVVFNSGQKEVEYPDRVPLTPEVTMSHFERMSEIDPYTACLFRIVVHDYAYPVTKDNINKSVSAFKHLVGLFSLSLFLMVEGKKFVWKYPEYCLHPRYQGNIADAMILMSDQEHFIRFIRSVQKGYFDPFILAAEEEGDKIIKHIYK